jgi:hypothetical protein
MSGSARVPRNLLRSASVELTRGRARSPGWDRSRIALELLEGPDAMRTKSQLRDCCLTSPVSERLQLYDYAKQQIHKHAVDEAQR